MRKNQSWRKINAANDLLKMFLVFFFFGGGGEKKKQKKTASSTMDAKCGFGWI